MAARRKPQLKNCATIFGKVEKRKIVEVALARQKIRVGADLKT